MNWVPLEREDQLEEIDQNSSENKGVLIFKHSTRCSISSMAKSRMEREWTDNPDLPVYYLDLIRYRSLSNLVAERYGVRHESPQILLIKDGKCVYDASHSSISAGDILSQVS